MIFCVDEKCKALVSSCAKRIPEVSVEIRGFRHNESVDCDTIYAHYCYMGYVVEVYDERFNYEKIVFDSEYDYLYYIIDAMSFVAAIDYVKDIIDVSKEYREIVFNKELDIFKRFGEAFFTRKRAEIMKYLEND